MKQPIQVVMFPTNKGTINYDENNKELMWAGSESIEYFNRLTPRHNPQHLYFTSDEEIKEGDYVYDSKDNCIRFVKKILKDEWCAKIIATTDKSLTYEIPCPDKIEDCEVLHLKQLPQIPYSFVKDFVEAKGEIKEVFIEYNEPCCKCRTMEETSKCVFSDGDDCHAPNPNNDFYGHNLVLTDDNFVIIN